MHPGNRHDRVGFGVQVQCGHHGDAQLDIRRGGVGRVFGPQHRAAARLDSGMARAGADAAFLQDQVLCAGAAAKGEQSEARSQVSDGLAGHEGFAGGRSGLSWTNACC